MFAILCDFFSGGGGGENFNWLHSRNVNTQWLGAFDREPVRAPPAPPGRSVAIERNLGSTPSLNCTAAFTLQLMKIAGGGRGEHEHGNLRVLCKFHSIGVADVYGWSVITVPFSLPKVQHYDRCMELPHFQIA